MEVKPLTLKQANQLVERWHRHHKPCRGHRFSLGAFADGEPVGACIVGRPVARAVDPYEIAEVNRLVTNGHRNACSFLYGAAARTCRAMGFRELWTYILASESGASLRGAGWVCDGQVRRDGKGWNNRPGRREDQPQEAKVRWRIVFKP